MRRTGAPRRQTEWLGLSFATGFSTIPAGSKLQVATMDADEITKLPFTVTRTIGLLTVKSDQNVGLELTMGALGFCVVSERAQTVGITALPDPVTEVAADFWFLYQPWSCVSEFDAGGDLGTLGVNRYAFDSRAQRKVEEGETIIGVIANSSSVHGANFFLSFRMLIKLH